MKLFLAGIYLVITLIHTQTLTRMYFDFIVSDTLLSISQNNICFKPFPAAKTSFLALGRVGDVFSFKFQNKRNGENGIWAVVQIGNTLTLTTNALYGWGPSSFNKLQTQKTVKSQTIYGFGGTVNTETYEITFTFPNMTPTCGTPVPQYFQRKEIQQIAFPSNIGYPYTITILSLPPIGTLKEGTRGLGPNDSFLSTAVVTYEAGDSYYSEKIDYKVDINGQTTSCSYNIRVCYESCATCHVSSSSTPTTTVHNCIECADRYAKVETTPAQPTNCIPLWRIHNYLYYDETQETFKDCHPNCERCSQGGDATTNNCDECKQPLYFYEDETEKKNCVPKRSDTNYYLHSDINTYEKCDTDCKTCSLPGFHSQPNCNSCNNGWFFYEGQPDTKCNLLLADNSGYYKMNDKYLKCFVTCKTCQTLGAGTLSDHKCDSCVADYAFYEGKAHMNCFNETGSNDGYFKVITENRWYKCYPTCKKCFRKGTNLIHACTLCYTGFTLKDSNCVPNCKGKLLLNEFDILICVDTCPIEKPYIRPDTNECVANCHPDFPYHDNNQCYSSCPSGTVLNNDFCVNSCFPLPTPELFAHIPHTVSECIDYINTSILQYRDIDKTIKGIDFTLQVYNTHTPFQAKESISSMEFINCESKLREVHGFSALDTIIIAKYDLPRNDSMVDQIEYDAFDYSGKKLDLGVCTNITINITYPVHDLKEKYPQVFDFLSNSINILDLNHSFYTDDCYSASVKGVDIPLLNRKHNYYLPICESNCVFNSIAASFHQVLCLCQAKPKSVFTIRNQTQAQYPIEDYTNLILGKCYHLLFNWSNLTFNIPFWSMGVINIANIIIVIMYFIRGIKAIFPKLLSRERQEYNDTLKKMKNFKKGDLSQLKKLEVDSNSLKEENQNNVEFYNKSRPVQSNPPQSFKQLLWTMMKAKVYFLQLFFPVSPIEITPLKLSHMLFFILFSFSLTSVLFGDYLVLEKHEQSQWNWGWIFLNGFSVCLINWIISSLMYSFISIEHFLETLPFSFKNIKPNDGQIQWSLRQLTKTITLFLLISLPLNIIGLYYTSLFAIIYKESQLIWLIAGLNEIGLALTLRIGFCLMITSLKYWGKTKYSGKLIKFAHYFENKF